MDKHKIITLCGSTRFKEEFTHMEKNLTLQGYIVLSLSLFTHSDDKEFFDNMPENERRKVFDMLDEVHKEKIRMSDEIFVINKDGYIGESTSNEIQYAISMGKTVRYLE